MHVVETHFSFGECINASPTVFNLLSYKSSSSRFVSWWNVSGSSCEIKFWRKHNFFSASLKRSRCSGSRDPMRRCMSSNSCHYENANERASEIVSGGAVRLHQAGTHLRVIRKHIQEIAVIRSLIFPILCSSLLVRILVLCGWEHDSGAWCYSEHRGMNQRQTRIARQSPLDIRYSASGIRDDDGEEKLTYFPLPSTGAVASDVFATSFADVT